MCGINGILRLAPDAPPVDRDECVRTREAMAARGPDGAGLWADETIALGHRRLSIIDLSAAGDQPMALDERYRIVFNGEIYNYRELRAELEAAGERFASHSDTEVLLRLFRRDGAAIFSRIRGMFALAIWDAVERRLILARDPYGIKPLYYGVHGGALRFASQVKALLAGGAVPVEHDPAGIAGFLMWGSVPEPRTFVSGLSALPAGSWLEVRDGRVGEPCRYRELAVDPAPADESLADAFEATTRAHLVADVPVGLFLSAGLDSSLIAALAQRRLDEPLGTFTLAFEVYRHTPRDEAPLAAEIAAALGTRHVERVVRREDFLDLWPRALAAMDQPSIDGFNTYVVSHEAAAAGFKVVMSGLGGDELLGGYQTFQDVPRWMRWVRTGRAVPGLGAVWPWLARRAAPHKPKLPRIIELGAALPGAYFLRRGLYMPDELAPILGAERVEQALADYDPLADVAAHADGAPDSFTAIHRLESMQYMRNQLLRDADWASMAHSLEIRVPLVDAFLRDTVERHRFEPSRSGGKAALVRELAPELPEALWDRPKSGFSIPVTEWLENQAGVDSAPGLASRRLALAVLAEFGVDLATERRASLA